MGRMMSRGRRLLVVLGRRCDPDLLYDRGDVHVRTDVFVCALYVYTLSLFLYELPLSVMC